MKILKLLIILILTSNLSKAEVLKFDITGYDRTLHTYKEVCRKMGHKELLLVEQIDALHLDCMGHKVNVTQFCSKNKEKTNLLRGFVNAQLKEVTCQYGQSAFLSVACDKRDKHLCSSPRKGCQILNEIYALEHNLFEYSFIEKDVDDVLNCMFQKKNLPELQKVTEKILLPFQEKEVIDRDLFADKK